MASRYLARHLLFAAHDEDIVFTLPGGEVMFCRFYMIEDPPFPDRLCSSQWWQFSSGPEPSVIGQGGTLCVD